MKKKIMAMGLAVVLTLSMSLTAFAASSTTSKNSGDQGTTVEQAQPGGAVKTDTVQVAVTNPDGTVKAQSLTETVTDKQAEVKQIVAAVAAAGDTAAISNILSAPASPMFTATVEALAQMKGGNVAVNNMGTVKTAATAQDALGNTIASAGVIKNVTSGALVMLMSVNADGTIEYVEGIVDPLTGSVIGAFKGVPAVITVMVLA